MTKFDIDTTVLHPVSVPLRRVPLQHQSIVTDLIDKYMKLDLLEPIDSPFRASTVLVQKKNAAQSEDVSDQYRICTDYRALNKVLPSSCWPRRLLRNVWMQHVIPIYLVL